MEHLDNSGGNNFPPPEIMARKIRSGYTTFFAAPVVCAVAAVFFAVGKEWMTSTTFAGVALIYFSISLSQYHSSKKICEEAIQKYQQWHQQNQNGTESSD